MRQPIQIARRWIPRGSPLWYPYFYAKRCLQRKPLTDIAWWRLHGNILLEQQKAIYFDIPKVACSSLKRVWAQVLDVMVEPGNPSETIHLAHFPYAKTYQIHKRYPDYFKFCFVRNPWDRLVSCYMDKIKDAQGGIYRHHENYFVHYFESRGICPENMTFEEFVDVVYTISDDEAESHFRSQHCFIQNHRGDIVADFVGRFERINHDFALVAEKLGISVALPHLRSTVRRDYREYYSDRAIERVSRRYARDIELFGYSFSTAET